MSVSSKLIVGLMAVIGLMLVVGGAGLTATGRAKSLYKDLGGDFAEFTNAATDIASWSKRTEGHLMMYLLYGDEEDREKFYTRADSLDESIARVERLATSPGDKTVLDELKASSVAIRHYGTALLAKYDASNGSFDIAQHEELVRQFYEAIRSARELGAELSTINQQMFEDELILYTDSDVVGCAKRAEGHLLLFLAFGDQVDRDKFHLHVDMLEHAVMPLRTHTTDPAEPPLIDSLSQQVNDLKTYGAELLAIYDRDPASFDARHYDELVSKMHDAASSARQTGVDLSALAAGRISATVNGVNDSVVASQRIALAAAGLAFLIAVAIAVLMYRSLVRPVRLLRDAFQALGWGRLDTRVDITAKDEMGTLAESFNRMAAEIEANTVSRAFMNNILESMGDGLIVTDPSGCIVTSNAAASRLSGYSQTQLLGMPVAQLLDESNGNGKIHVPVSEDVSEAKTSFEGFWLPEGGDRVPVNVSVAALRDVNGEQSGHIYSVRDVTERRRAERQIEALLEAERNSTKEWQQLFDAAPDIITLLSPDHVILRANKSALDAVGLSREEVIGRKCYEVVHGTAAPIAACPCVNVRITKGTGVNEIEEHGRHYRVSATPVLGSNGEITAFTHTVQDVTERKEWEETLQRSNALLDAIAQIQEEFILESDKRTVFDSLLSRLLLLTSSEYGFIGEVLTAPDGSPYLKTHAISDIAWDATTREFYDKNVANGLEFHNLQTLFGAVVTSGKPVIANDPSSHPSSGGLPKGHPPLNAFLGLPLYLGEQLVGEIGIANRPGGYDQEMIEYLQPYLHSCANLIDSLKNTERRRQAEQALRESEELYRAVVENMDEGVAINVSAKRVFVNKAFLDIHALQDDSLVIGEPITKFHHPEDRDGVVVRNLALQNEKWMHVPPDYRIVRQDGEVRHAQVSVASLTYKGQPATLSIIRDVTERRQAEETLRQSEELYRAVVENMDEGIGISRDGKRLFVNRAFLNLHGLEDGAQVIGEPLDKFTHPEDREAMMTRHRARQRGELPVSPVERRIVKTDGEVRTVQTRAVPISYMGLPSVLAVMRDVTEERRAQQSLRESEHLYRAVVEHMAEAISINREGRRLFVNKAFLDIHGLKDDSQVIGEPMDKFILPEDREAVLRRHLARQRGERVPSPNEYRMLRPDGDVRTLQSFAVALEYQGQTATLSVLRDVTEERRAAQALQESEELHRTVVENVGDAIAINVDGNRVFVNKAFLDIHALQDDSQVIGRPMNQFIVPVDKEKIMERNLARQRGEDVPRYINSQIVRADGEIRDVQTQATAVQYKGRRATLAVIRDVTEAERAEEELRRLTEFNKTILDSMTEAICVIDVRDFSIVGVNRGFLEQMGVTEEEVIGKACYRVTHGRSEPCVPPKDVCPLRETLQSRVTSVAEHEHRRKDGEMVHVEVATSPVFDGEGRLVQVIHVSRNITERKRAEHALRESEELHRAVVEHMEEAVAINRDARRIFVNKAFLDIHGLKDFSEAIGQPMEKFIHPKDREWTVARNLARQRGEPQPSPSEYRIMRPDGEVRTVQGFAVPLQYGGVPGTLSVIRDITEERRSEEERTRHEQEMEKALRNLQEAQQQLIQSEKLAAIGGLVSGIAHELNNPLTGVWGTSQLVMRRGVDETLREDMEVIHSEASRAVKIVQNLLSFARSHKAEKTYASVNDALDKTLLLRAYEMRVSGIDLEVELQSDLPETWFDYHQMQQVFLNIIINSEQAMNDAHGGGHLLIRTQRVGENIQISFADDGPGIPKGNLGKIFDPFFTTKQVGKGTGLGLSICYGIVQEHDGAIWVESEEGKGATFFVEIPITNGSSYERPQIILDEDELLRQDSSQGTPKRARGQDNARVEEDDPGHLT